MPTKYPFPAILSDQLRANLDALESSSPIHYVYFPFDSRNFKQRKIITTLPAGSLVYGFVQFVSVEPFAPGVYNVQITTSEQDPINIGVYSTALLHNFINAYPVITMVPTTVGVSMFRDDNQNQGPTQGRGFGILTWIDLKKTEGYKNA